MPQDLWPTPLLVARGSRWTNQLVACGTRDRAGRFKQVAFCALDVAIGSLLQHIIHCN